MVSTTCGLCLVLQAIVLLLCASLEVSLWDTQHVRYGHVGSSSTCTHGRLLPSHCMDHAVRGQLMLHTATLLTPAVRCLCCASGCVAGLALLSLDGYYRVLSTLNTLPVTSNRVLGEGRRVVVRSQGSLLAAP